MHLSQSIFISERERDSEKGVIIVLTTDYYPQEISCITIFLIPSTTPIHSTMKTIAKPCPKLALCQGKSSTRGK
jgi:hypothetical protein